MWLNIGLSWKTTKIRTTPFYFKDARARSARSAGRVKKRCSNSPKNACECSRRSIFSSFKLCKSSQSFHIGLVAPKTLTRQNLSKIEAHSSIFLCCFRGDPFLFFIYIVLLKQDLHKSSFWKRRVGSAPLKKRKNPCKLSWKFVPP